MRFMVITKATADSEAGVLPGTEDFGRRGRRHRRRPAAAGMAFGPEAGLALLDQLMAFPALRNYHLLPSARGDFLARLGRHAEARAEFERAASLTRNERERTLLLDRAAACVP
ncbi:hypothetical protein [Actinoplanes sp. GCM10030250]|uniref:hypothetical protein n=1 Tax=Actinoplanes sp. GCM10030250 TaxID=3273376 RepID=UPI00360C5BE1